MPNSGWCSMIWAWPCQCNFSHRQISKKVHSLSFSIGIRRRRRLLFAQFLCFQANMNRVTRVDNHFPTVHNIYIYIWNNSRQNGIRFGCVSIRSRDGHKWFLFHIVIICFVCIHNLFVSCVMCCRLLLARLEIYLTGWFDFELVSRTPGASS